MAAVGRIFLRRKGSTENYRCAENAKVALRDVNAIDLFGVFAGEIEAGAGKVVGRNFSEDSCLSLIGMKFRNARKVIDTHG